MPTNAFKTPETYMDEIDKMVDHLVVEIPKFAGAERIDDPTLLSETYPKLKWGVKSPSYAQRVVALREARKILLKAKGPK